MAALIGPANLPAEAFDEGALGRFLGA